MPERATPAQASGAGTERVQPTTSSKPAERTSVRRDCVLVVNGDAIVAAGPSFGLEQKVQARAALHWTLAGNATNTWVGFSITEAVGHDICVRFPRGGYVLGAIDAPESVTNASMTAPSAENGVSLATFCLGLGHKAHIAGGFGIEYGEIAPGISLGSILQQREFTFVVLHRSHVVFRDFSEE